MKNIKPYDRINAILRSIKNNHEKIVRLEKKIDAIKNEEVRFQARLAILDYYHIEIQE